MKKTLVILTVSILISLNPLSLYAQENKQLENNQIEEQHLNEVVVKGQRAEIKSEDGVIVVDLAKIVENKPVTNILEALGYLPGVVNNNGMISLSGSSSTTIAINGEPSLMSIEQLYQLLYSLPVERLKNIEVMYSAPAKYHTVGAVINVVLKTQSTLDGLQGQARIGYNHSHYGSYGGGLSAVYTIGKWDFDLNYSLSKSHTFQGEDVASCHTLYDGKETNFTVFNIEDKTRSSKKALVNLLHCSVGFNLSPSSVIRLTYNAQIKGDARSEHSSKGTLGNYKNLSTFQGPITLHNVNINYKSDFGLTLNADYLNYQEKRSQELSEMAISFLWVNSFNTQRINRYRFTADMEHDLNGWTLGYGTMYSGSNDQSSMKYIVPENPGFSNTLKEHNAKVYLSLSHSFPWGLSFQSSLGEELYRREGEGDRNQWIFSPQLGMTYYSYPKHILQLNFSTRRDYPSYWDLHGGVGYTNPYTEIWGNPLLKPSTTYEGTLSYILLQKYVATFFVNDTQDYAVQLPYQPSDQLKLIFQTTNLNFSRKAGLVLNAPFSFGDWFDTRFTLQGFYANEKSDHFHNMSFSRHKLTGYAMTQNTFKITKSFSLTLDISGITSSLQGIADIYGMWNVDAGAKFNFGKKSCCELTLNASDIFNTWNPILRIKYGTQNYRMDTREFTHSLRLTFLYRFNGFKPKNNQEEDDIDISRLGTK